MKVLITGASSGIGKEFAKEFAKKDFDLILVARREELLQNLKEEIEKEYSVNCDYIALDLLKDVDELYEYCKSQNHEVNILVNNAGFGDFKDFLDADINKLMDMIELNNKALVKLTYLFAKDMKEVGYGHIINVGSVASFVPGPHMAVYYATKSFVLSFSLALREELKNFGVRVSTLCPGPTDTPFWEVANGKSFKNAFTRSSKQAAKTGVEMFLKNKPYSIDGSIYKLAINATRLLPPSLSSKIIGKTQKTFKK